MTLNATLDTAFETWLPYLYNYCRSVVEDEQRALELYRNTVRTAHQSRGELEGSNKSPLNWLVDLASQRQRNDEARRGRNNLFSDEVLSLGSPLAGAIQRFLPLEWMDFLRSASSSWDSKEQELVLLRYGQGSSVLRTSTLLGEQEETTTRRLAALAPVVRRALHSTHGGLHKRSSPMRSTL